MLQEGLISQAEFDAKKEELLKEPRERARGGEVVLCIM